MRLFKPWATKALSLLDVALPLNSHHRKLMEKIEAVTGQNGNAALDAIYAFRAIAEDFKDGMFDSLAARIEGDVAHDYLEQAHQLLTEKGSDRDFSHIPAAVLAGVVLERTIRNLCETSTPPIPTIRDNGKPRSFEEMLTALVKGGVFGKSLAKELQAYYALRSDAAHGRTEEVDSERVSQMIKGIHRFLSWKG